MPNNPVVGFVLLFRVTQYLRGLRPKLNTAFARKSYMNRPIKFCFLWITDTKSSCLTLFCNTHIT